MNNGNDLNYLEKNRELWNKRTEIHIHSDFYDMSGFLAGHTSLNDIELALLGDIKGKSVLHLQCHFGQDTISLARMGAHCTGVDLSDKSIEQARLLAQQTGADARFVCCDIYDLPRHLDEQFDIVFTSYGTITWLPDIDKWSAIVARYLKPGGQLVFADFHPVVWMFDNDFEKVAYNYFNSGPIAEVEAGTYADPQASVHMEYIGWNHSISEVVNNLIGQGLEITRINEYDYSPYNCFRHMEKVGDKQYRIKHMGNNIPMVYAIVAVKKDNSKS